MMTLFDWLAQRLDSDEVQELVLARDYNIPSEISQKYFRIVTEHWQLSLTVIDNELGPKPDAILLCEVLNAGFDWEHTPQGSIYWSAIMNKYEIRAGIHSARFTIN